MKAKFVDQNSGKSYHIQLPNDNTAAERLLSLLRALDSPIQGEKLQLEITLVAENSNGFGLPSFPSSFASNEKEFTRKLSGENSLSGEAIRLGMHFHEAAQIFTEMGTKIDRLEKRLRVLERSLSKFPNKEEELDPDRIIIEVFSVEDLIPEENHLLITNLVEEPLLVTDLVKKRNWR